MKKSELRGIIRELIKEMDMAPNEIGHVKDLGWYPKSLDKFQKDEEVNEEEVDENQK